MEKYLKAGNGNLEFSSDFLAYVLKPYPAKSEEKATIISFYKESLRLISTLRRKAEKIEFLFSERESETAKKLEKALSRFVKSEKAGKKKIKDITYDPYYIYRFIMSLGRFFRHMAIDG